ncbi:hypothetical protein SETIT_9G049400v2 [Setaria italica]|uniref:Uncharacterized protein n=1 Tax=Setaria italica TaxID=4555 RepID=A0A368SF03_SETIT|nr:hypothetical protein SETIT_9G049400v2 [Setaria italica]
MELSMTSYHNKKAGNHFKSSFIRKHTKHRRQLCYFLNQEEVLTQKLSPYIFVKNVHVEHVYQGAKEPSTEQSPPNTSTKNSRHISIGSTRGLLFFYFCHCYCKCPELN